MLSELSRREKAANIKPDPDLDVYMKVTKQALVNLFFSKIEQPKLGLHLIIVF